MKGSELGDGCNLRPLVCEVVGVIEISNDSVRSRYDSKITVTIFKDRPEMTVSLNLESDALDESLFWCILGFEYCELFNEFFLRSCMYCSVWCLKFVLANGACFG
jgi:hypothetical protein